MWQLPGYTGSGLVTVVTVVLCWDQFVPNHPHTAVSTLQPLLGLFTTLQYHHLTEAHLTQPSALLMLEWLNTYFCLRDTHLFKIFDKTGYENI